MDYRYITLFDNLGFESIIDISINDEAKVEEILNAGSLDKLEKNINSLITSILFRAKANEHRYPEIWIFWSEIEQKTLWNAAQENPQMMADLIRERGECLYKTHRPKAIIT